MQRKGKGAKSTPKGRKAKQKDDAVSSRRCEGRLRPGQLDGLVLAYLKKHRGELPLSPTVVAHGIKRSSGAVANCLGRLEQAGEVRLANRKPREYDLAGKNSK